MSRVFFKQQNLQPQVSSFYYESYNNFVNKKLKKIIYQVFHEGNSLGIYSTSVKLKNCNLSESECIDRLYNYESSVIVNFCIDRNGEKNYQEVEIAKIPQITKYGYYIINGIKRVFVPQLVRSPGVFFLKEDKIFVCKIIPDRGSWIDIHLDEKNISFFIDKKKSSLSFILNSLGSTSAKEVLENFYTYCEVYKENKKWKFKEESKINSNFIENDEVNVELLKGSYVIVKDEKTPFKIDSNNINLLENTDDFILLVEKKISASFLINSIFDEEKIPSKKLFDLNQYTFSSPGRMKLKQELNIDSDIITSQILIECIKRLIELYRGDKKIKDIDSLQNRRIKDTFEIFEKSFYSILQKAKDSLRIKLNDVKDNFKLSTFINNKNINVLIKDFFVSLRFSQFMDERNPISSLTHKRKISSLGGSSNKERASINLRDLRVSQRSRICPIETPEGQSIGLISNLAIYAKVNKDGFIEAPYYKVKNKKILTDKIHYLTAYEEANSYIISRDVNIKDDVILDRNVNSRYMENYVSISSDMVEYIEVSKQQMLSISSSLIPFIENNESARALMGANMQKQAVPTIYANAPLVGSGNERIAAEQSNYGKYAEQDATVILVTSTYILLKYKDSTFHVCELERYKSSNEKSCKNYSPCVYEGQELKKGDVLANGFSIQNGELALGQNLTVAFMPWYGYSFEDSIVISERLVHENILTSYHIEKFDCYERDTKLGREEITNDLPFSSPEKMAHLNDRGIAKTGSILNPGDIIVGKVTPKLEEQHTPELKLISALIKRDHSSVKDSSLKMPLGCKGTVIDSQVYYKRNKSFPKCKEYQDSQVKKIQKEYKKIEEKIREQFRIDIRPYLEKHNIKNVNNINIESVSLIKNEKFKIESQNILSAYKENFSRLEKEYKRKEEVANSYCSLPQDVNSRVSVTIMDKKRISIGDKLSGRHGNKGVISKIVPIEDMPFTKDGIPVDLMLNSHGIHSRMNIGQIFETHLGMACEELGKKIKNLLIGFSQKEVTAQEIKDQIVRIYGKEYACISEYEAIKLADKLSNGVSFACPLFIPTIENIENMLKEANCDTSGKVTLIDGITGKEFENKVTVGKIYIMKLHHLASDKMHARSTGPYSIVAQQPLRGKAQSGGQRGGEMELWCIEGFGASNVLQEFVTVKSDDVFGRNKMFESLVNNTHDFITGTPEAFIVAVKEIKSLGIKIELIK